MPKDLRVENSAQKAAKPLSSFRLLLSAFCPFAIRPGAALFISRQIRRWWS
jgi:hypothetical protein